MATTETLTGTRRFRPLPLGSIVPRGWLREQLVIQAEGLSGHLDEFWPQVGPDSAWLGGKGESWELGPYYLDGLVPLAFLLEDRKLQTKIARWTEWALSNRGADGWIGPKTDHPDKWWPRAVMLKVLAQYAEATGDKRVEPAMAEYFGLIAKSLESQPLTMWAKFRWGEYLPSLLWLCDRRPCPMIMEIARLLYSQGYNWTDHFTYFMIENPVRQTWNINDQCNLATHVVNQAMAVKYPGLWSLFSGRDEDRRASDFALGVLDRFHGQATGIFTGDEHLAGRNPSRGTELCAVVEFMYSLEVLTSLFGNTAYADRLESVAYNNLPGAFTADMWAHQYDQQANQVLCTVAEREWSNGKDANIYGLEPNYVCCTANFNQGWPKFVSHLWMRTAEDGLSAVAYGPCEVRLTRGNVQVQILEKTDYPFRGDIEFEVRTSSPLTLPISFRIPGWAEGAEVIINDDRPVQAKPGNFHTVTKRWEKNDRVTIRLPMRLRISTRYNNAVAVHRGPLTFSLQIGARWTQIAGEEPHADYEVRPSTPWNYALVLDREKPGQTLEVSERSVDMPCFSEFKAPVTISAKARLLPTWGMEGASAAPPPPSPVATKNQIETVTLIPYGSAKLRITEFPYTGE